ncbi:DNA-directed RNA polymerase III subunit RPC4-like [Argiope bruennichi]|uniref:DNA-directed RNA polymerase III subunit RPC4-like n=1 Tax=Argiope bruennichi TaxID=94029 RepID=UPI0024947906|nr:DNA-directed RNA polymerase III subunit RPC4-like [Argiope bruennichi]
MAQQPEDKKPDFSNFPRGAIGIKGLPVGRNARLPSIRSPRDLTLGSQPKRTFTPNIPVRREKKPTDLAKGGGESSSEGVSNRNNKNATPRAERGRGRGRGKGQIIQLEGALFGEGIAPSAVKGSFRQRESIPRSEFSSGRPYIKKEKSEYDIQHMEQEMKLLLRDDFIDDGDDSNSGDESMKPVIFPVKEIKGKQEKLEKDEEKPENFQNQDFAKTMGFNVEKIAKFIKKEKTEDADLVAEPDWSKVPRNEVTELLTSRDSPFFLLQIPQCITTQANDYQSKAVENPVSSDEKKNVTTLASMSEGTIGKLQILKSGRARLKIGSLDFYISDMCPLIGKHELVSIKIDSGSGDLASLGNCEKSLILEPDIDSLMPDIKTSKS